MLQLTAAQAEVHALRAELGSERQRLAELEGYVQQRAGEAASRHKVRVKALGAAMRHA